MAPPTKDTPLIKAALAVAKKYPCFPTNGKKPCWSNKELGVKKGEGVYKIATQDPAEVERLFSHPRATEVSVPTGEVSGIVVVDVDTYKDPELKAFADSLPPTLTHKTRSGGLHFIYRHPGDGVRFPATLRPGVDLKANGGFVCWPGTEGYEVFRKLKISRFPMDVLQRAMIEKGGTGSTSPGSSWNEATDEELIEQIKSATTLYPALRSLAYRMALRPGGLSGTDMVMILQNLMNTSVAADNRHPRHEDWLDRYGKINDLVASAIEKERGEAGLTSTEIEAMSRGESLLDLKGLTATSRPIGPQRETTPSDIEKRVAELKPSGSDSEPSTSEETSDFVSLNDEQLNAVTLPPIKWVIPRMIPEMSTVSLAGMSNVGKTRWLAG